MHSAQSSLLIIIFYILTASRCTQLATERLKQPFRRQRVMQPSDAECSICYGEYRVGTYVAVPQCGHRFHHSCLTKWSRHSRTCPLCRATLHSPPSSPDERRDAHAPLRDA